VQGNHRKAVYAKGAVAKDRQGPASGGQQGLLTASPAFVPAVRLISFVRSAFRYDKAPNPYSHDTYVVNNVGFRARADADGN
jgi:hypothetical protein